LNEAEVVREAMAVIDSKESKLKETVEAATNEILLSKTDTVQSIQSAGEEFNLKSKQNLDMIEKSRNDIINDIEIEAKKVRDQIKADAHAAVTSTSQRIVEMEEVPFCLTL
jgi:vacuolar-type H+-ATPase subunit H